METETERQESVLDLDWCLQEVCKAGKIVLAEREQPSWNNLRSSKIKDGPVPSMHQCHALERSLGPQWALSGQLRGLRHSPPSRMARRWYVGNLSPSVDAL